MHKYWIHESRKHLIFIVHGGGFVKGNFTEVEEIERGNLRGMLAERGLDVAVTNYTLATRKKPSFPIALWDIQLCLNAVRARLNPLSVTMVGTSAGATLALMSTLNYLHNNNPAHKPSDRLALFYGIYDFTNYEDLATDPFDVQEGLLQFIGAKGDLSPPPVPMLTEGERSIEIAQAKSHLRWRNPLRSDLGLLAETPIFLAHGRDDQVVDINQSRELAGALRNSGHENVTLTMPNDHSHHGFPIASMIDALAHFTYSGKTQP